MYISKKNIIKLASNLDAMKSLNELAELLSKPDTSEYETEIDILAYTLRRTLEEIK